MAKVTSKRQVTIPKAIADRYGIASGDQLEFLPAGDAIRVRRSEATSASLDRDQRLQLFDRATKRQHERQQGRAPGGPARGWRREDLYERARAR